MTHHLSVDGKLNRGSDGDYEAVFDRSSSCANCLKSSACSASVFSGGEHRVGLASPGQMISSAEAVTASLPANQLVMLAAAAYLLPAVVCVLCAWIATLALPFERDAAALLGAVCGLVLSAAAIRAADMDRSALACVKIRVFASGRR